MIKNETSLAQLDQQHLTLHLHLVSNVSWVVWSFFLLLPVGISDESCFFFVLPGTHIQQVFLTVCVVWVLFKEYGHMRDDRADKHVYSIFQYLLIIYLSNIYYISNIWVFICQLLNYIANGDAN